MSEQSFLKNLQEHFEFHGDVLSPFRQKGLQRLGEIGLPSRSHEAFRYVPLRELYLSSFRKSKINKLEKSSFAKAILPECAHSHLVFIDGAYSSELSDTAGLPAQMVIASLEDAMQTHGGFLQRAIRN